MIKYPLAIIRGLLLALLMFLMLIPLTLSTWIFGRRDSRGFWYRRTYMRIGCYILGIRMDDLQTYRPKETALYVCNHRTIADIFIPVSFIDGHIIAKAEIASMPLLSYGAEMTGIIFVQRSDRSSRGATIEKTRELLASGRSVVVFAEGTTTVEQATQPFKKGTFKVAAELGIPIVPMALEYRDAVDYWQNISAGAQFVKQHGRWSTHAKLRMGEMIRGKDANDLVQRTQSWIDEQLTDMQRGWSTVF